jgi:3-methyl-2-oxobutanoate hydroxymethyltransferase
MAISSRAKKVTTHTLQEMKASGEKITMLTSYDYSLARLVDAAGIDVILVGDSASNVMAGNETTVPITLDHMIYHAQCVINGVDRALVVVDMPFGTYQGDSKTALDSAIRIMKESGGHAVKLEGGSEIVESVVRIQQAGIPVMGHLGLTPQSIYKFGTYSVRAKEQVTIPTIGIGAGVDCDGQVLVLHDMLGITKDFSPRFLRRYSDLGEIIDGAVKQYIDDVRSKQFPNADEGY